MAGLVEKRRIVSLLIQVAWDVGLGSVGAVGAASRHTPTSLQSQESCGGPRMEAQTRWGWEVEGSGGMIDVGRSQLQRSSLRCGAGFSQTPWLSCGQ